MSNFNPQQQFNEKLDELFNNYKIGAGETRNTITEILDTMIVKENTGENLSSSPQGSITDSNFLLQITALLRETSGTINRAQTDAKDLMQGYKDLMEAEKAADELRESLFSDNDQGIPQNNEFEVERNHEKPFTVSYTLYTDKKKNNKEDPMAEHMKNEADEKKPTLKNI